MTYIVKVENNYEAFQKCVSSLPLSRLLHVRTPVEHYQEIARFIEKKYKVKCHLYKSNLTRDKMVAFDELEFPSEQDYLLWLLKFG